MFSKFEIYSWAVQGVDGGSVEFASRPSLLAHPPLSLFALALLWRSHKVRPPAAIYKCPTLFLPLSPRSPCHQLSPSKSGRAVYPGSRRRDVSPRCDASHARRQKTPDAIHTCGISKFPHHHSVTRARARVHTLGRTQVVKRGTKTHTQAGGFTHPLPVDVDCGVTSPRARWFCTFLYD